MLHLLPTLLLLFIGGDELPPPTGDIHGVVLDGTNGNRPAADVAVILRAGPDGALAPMAETRTDIYGKFSFDSLPLDASTTYLVGAERGGVYYPGARTRLVDRYRLMQTTIVVYDAEESASPLIAQRHEIDLHVEQKLMTVRETIVISNPTLTTYVGQPASDGSRVTLELSIPPNFDRVTFDEEYFGRRFRIVDHRLQTDIPWTPGRRELKFTYHVPLENASGVFHRPLDLPCGDFRIQARGENIQRLTCNLPQPMADVGDAAAIFNWLGKPFPPGYRIELKIGAQPFVWLRFSRWASLVVIVFLAIATIIVLRKRERPAAVCWPKTPDTLVTGRNHRVRQTAKRPPRKAA